MNVTIPSNLELIRCINSITPSSRQIYDHYQSFQFKDLSSSSHLSVDRSMIAIRSWSWQICHCHHTFKSTSQQIYDHHPKGWSRQICHDYYILDPKDIITIKSWSYNILHHQQVPISENVSLPLHSRSDRYHHDEASQLKQIWEHQQFPNFWICVIAITFSIWKISSRLSLAVETCLVTINL